MLESIFVAFKPYVLQLNLIILFRLNPLLNYNDIL